MYYRLNKIKKGLRHSLLKEGFELVPRYELMLMVGYELNKITFKSRA